MDLSKVFSFQKNSPATENEINFSENNILGDLPEVYKQFLRETNGMVLNLCVLYDTDSIVEMYKVNEFAKYAPNYLSIGNDNGDRELVIKAEKDACVCGFLDAGAIGTAEPDEWFNFVLWIENGCEMLEEKPAEWGNISIINIPDDKLKFLMEMKKIFALSISCLLYTSCNNQIGSKRIQSSFHTLNRSIKRFQINTEECFLLFQINHLP